MCSLSFFHYTEYLVTAVINPHSLSLDSFLLNHSMEYTLAAVSSWVEFTVEKLTVPGGTLRTDASRTCSDLAGMFTGRRNREFQSQQEHAGAL